MQAPRRRLPLLSLALPVVAALAVCCGASAANVRGAGGLTGAWSGKYSGAYHGTFALRWRESGSKLSGTIKLSTNPGVKLSVKGTVHGSTIRFGTVGSTAITYSGSVSGTSMSGTYHTPGGGGSWSAHKTS